MPRRRRDSARLRRTGRWKAATTTSRSGSRIRKTARQKNAAVHPRAYGTFTRILGKYVRDEHLLTLEEAIRKMTSQAASRVHFKDRGILREGMKADIVVFDPATIHDVATFEDPHHFSEGITDVVVNGVAVLRDGVITGALPGRAIRGRGYVKR